MTPPPALFLMGPTASGKTRLALALAERLPCDLISVDSVQVYRGLDIGSAKPDPQQQIRHPHRLIDLRDPGEPYSAADFAVDARREMQAIGGAGRIPLLVGGTMLYFRALEQGLAPLPEADPALRARLAEDLRELGSAGLHRRLAQVDPQAAARIHPNDPQRIQRALEVHELTGEPLSRHWERTPQGEPLPWRVTKLALVPLDRAALYRRIDQRFLQMLRDGLEGEVRGLFERGDLDPSLPALRAVGYRQVWAWLAGEVDHATMVGKAQAASRQYAKRQLTWLRAEPDLHRLDPDSPGLLEQALERLHGTLG